MTSQSKATTKYVKKTYDKIELRFRKDDPELLKTDIEARAKEMELSVNKYILELIKHDIKHHVL